MYISQEMRQTNRLVLSLLVLLFLICFAAPSQADDWEHRIGQGVPFAVGIGTDISNGDYGSNANATVVTIPLLLTVNPFESIDLTFELPLVYMNSSSKSSVVVTQSGAGRRRGKSTPQIPALTSSVTSNTSTTISEAGLGDISLSAGWTILQDTTLTPRIRPTLYLKAPTGDKNHGLGTGTIEAGPGLSLSKWLGDFQLFAEASYIFQDSTTDYQGKNYLSYSAGAGLQTTDRLFVSLYARGSSARIDEGTAPVEGRIKLNFLQSRRFSWEFYGLAGFTDASPAAGGGLLMMYQF